MSRQNKNNRPEQEAPRTECDVLEQKLLDAWADTRLPVPFDEMTPPELLTTLDIQDQLSPMTTVPLDTINQYMLANAYELTTVRDGTIRWMVWRKPTAAMDL